MVDQNSLDKFQYNSRTEKAKKIKNVLLDHLSGTSDPSQLFCLDLGCSIGVISEYLSHTFGNVVGVDLSSDALSNARSLHPNTNYTKGNGLRLPFGNHTFDVIVCAQVYEHSVEPYQLSTEIWRVLKPGGCVFFSGPNRLWPYEYHYRWYLLHWLPRTMLNRYCERNYGHRFDLVLYNYWQLRDLWRAFGWHDYTLKLIYEAEKFWDVTSIRRWARIIPSWFVAHLRFLLPNFNWLLTKPGKPDG